MGSHCQTPATSLSGGNFSLPRQWRRAAFAGQMMLGAELLLPPHGKGHLVALISFSFLRMAGTLQPSLRRERCALSLQQQQHRSASVAVSVQIGIIPSLPRACAASIRPLPATTEIDRRSGGRQSILSCFPRFRSELGRTDGRKEGPEGECTTNEAHPEHALPSLPASLGPDPRHHVLSLAATQCISDRFRLYSDI